MLVAKFFLPPCSVQTFCQPLDDSPLYPFHTRLGFLPCHLNCNPGATELTNILNDDLECEALLIDTSIFIKYALVLEKGLLGKLTQFKKSPVVLILPDVIYNEIKFHLEQKIKTSWMQLKKSIHEAEDHLFFDNATLNKAKTLLIEDKEISGLAETRLKSFIEKTGAKVIDCGEHVDVTILLNKYFSNEPPFSEFGKKKNEFPDAIVLMAIEKWAEKNNKLVLTISKDDDWVRYCSNSNRLLYISELSDGLAKFNKTNAPYVFLSKLEEALEKELAKLFLDSIASHLQSAFEGFTPDQDADSYLHWEPEGSDGWFKDFYLTSNELRILEHNEKFTVLEGKAAITVEAEGEFSLSVYDSIDHDYVHIDSVKATAEKEFQSNLLIKIIGDLEVPIEELEIDDVEIVSPIKRLYFGQLVPGSDDD